MSKYDQLPREEKELADQITLYANLERDSFENDVKNWLMTKEECNEQVWKLRDKIKTELCRILIRN